MVYHINMYNSAAAANNPSKLARQHALGPLRVQHRALTRMHWYFEKCLLPDVNSLREVTDISTNCIHSDTAKDCALRAPREVKARVIL